MGNEWHWDDSEIPGESVVYRRVLARPDFLIPDLEGGIGKPAPAALKWDPDGISVYRDTLLKDAGISIEELKKDDSDIVFGFATVDVRSSGAGVVDSPDPDDSLKGDAHASIRCPVPNPNNMMKREIRQRIIDSGWPAA